MIGWLESVEEDPLSGFAVFESSPLVLEWAPRLGWPLLPSHLHEILLFAAIHLALYLGTDPVLKRTTDWYAKLSPDQKGGIANHVCSQANAIILLILSFPLFFTASLTSLVSYTPYAGLVAAASSGYFLFDMYICIRWFRGNGWGFVLHAFAAFFVFMQGNRPFMHNYSAPFVWFEASTTFVNVHWLAANVPGLISEQVELVNGALLMLVFVLCRIIPGPINGVKLFRVALTEPLPGVPMWVVIVILVCYTTLSTLNFFWFGKMLNVAYKVLIKPKPKDTDKTELQEELPKPDLVPEMGRSTTKAQSRSKKRI